MFTQILKKIISTLVCGSILLQIAAPALAAGPAAALSTPGVQSRMTNGDLRITQNSVSSILAELQPGTAADSIFAMGTSSPMIWARYYPERLTGIVQAVVVSKDLNTGVVSVQIDTLGPDQGGRLAAGNGIKNKYGGVNPFTTTAVPGFNTGNGGVYNKITSGAFFAVVGTWAKYYKTQRGYVSVIKQHESGVKEWDECVMNSWFGCLKRRYHQEANAWVTPDWYVITSVDNAIGRSFNTAFMSLPCTTAIGTATVANKAACTVSSGVGFLKTTSQTDLPKDPAYVWYQHDSKDGLTWLAAIILIAVTGGLGYVGLLATGLEALYAMGFYTATSMSVLGFAMTLSAGLVGFSIVANPGIWDLLGSGMEDAIANDPHWNPNECIATGVHSHGTEGPGRLSMASDGSNCMSMLNPDLTYDQWSGIGKYFKLRDNRAKTDGVAIQNPVNDMRANILPMLNGGDSDRE